MKTTHTIHSPILQNIAHRVRPVHFRLQRPSLIDQRQTTGSMSEPGIAFEAGQERFSGEGYYNIAEQAQELEQLIRLKTVVLMTNPNR